MNHSTKQIDGDRIGFFFGAGSSVNFGIPSMTKMTEDFARQMDNSSNQEESNLFVRIYNSLKDAYGRDNIDLETIMSVIVGLKEKEHLKENIGELGLFILERKGIVDVSNEIDYKAEILETLENKFREHIRGKVVIHKSENIDLLREVYFDFFKQLCEVTNCSNTMFPDSDPWKYTHQKWTFFTTNYDNVIEDFWVRGRNHDLDLGFRNKNGKKVMNTDELVQKNASNNHMAMQLVKLHGSVNWVRYKNGEIEERELHTNLDEVKPKSGSKDIQSDIVIYPLSQKQLYFTPFIQLFRILNAELLKRDFWIIIGYSFRDIIIRTMFERALEDKNAERKILLVHPHGSEQVKPLFQEGVRDQIKTLDEYFAEKGNYSNVNRKIKEALSELSNT